MAKGSGNFLIVVSILEGRYFPCQPERQLIAEAKFDGEVMATDPVGTGNTGTPNFNTELAWEIDRKGLTLHRLQRTPIKLQCFSLCPGSNRRENVGYIILDLRLAREGIQDPKWYPLLNCRFQKERPEMFVGIHLEKECPTSANSSKEAAASSVTPCSASPAPKSSMACKISSLSGENLRPILNSSGGYYEIGPVNKACAWFTFSVTVACAENLDKLLPAFEDKIDSEDCFYFYYSLFGNDVCTERFPNDSEQLVCPSFPVERASVRIHSTPDLVRTFFLSHHPPLEILLCTGDMAVASALVDLSLLPTSSNLMAKPSVMEENYEVSLSPKSSVVLTKDELSTTPFVGVSITLKQDETGPTLSPENSADLISSEPCFANHLARKSLSHSSSQEHPRKEPIAVSSARRRLDYSHSPPQKIDKSGRLQDVAEETKISTPPCTSSPSPRHYCFTMDIQTLIISPSLAKTHLSLRYTYPFFGTTSTISTSPPIEVEPSCEVALPNGFCAFNFAATPAQLAKSFQNVPLIVEVLQHVRPKGENLIGCSKIDLSPVLEASPHNFTTEAGDLASKKTAFLSVNILTICGTKKLGKLQVAMGLDDMGAVTLNFSPESSHHQQDNRPKVKMRPVGDCEGSPNDLSSAKLLQAPPQGCSLEPSLPRPASYQDHLIQSAVEFELWKEKQEELFRKQLAEKEAHHFQTLSEEWKKRDAERELCFQKKMKECQQLEATLKKALSDLKSREAQLEAREAEFIRKQHDLARHQTQLKLTAKESMDRMKAESDYLVDLEKKRYQEVQEEKDKLLSKLEALEMKAREEECRIEQLHKKNFQALELQKCLESEIKSLKMEKSDLDTKMEACAASKRRYKQQWISALQEVNALHSRLSVIEQGSVAKRESEAEELRLEALTSQQLLHQERCDLEHVKSMLNRFSLDEEEKNKENCEDTGLLKNNITNRGGIDSITFQEKENSNTHLCCGTESSMDLDISEDHLSRLITERDNLLSTGVYTDKDQIIIELNRCIEKMKKNLGSKANEAKE